VKKSSAALGLTLERRRQKSSGFLWLKKKQRLATEFAKFISRYVRQDADGLLPRKDERECNKGSKQFFDTQIGTNFHIC